MVIKLKVSLILKNKMKKILAMFLLVQHGQNN